MTTHKKAQWIAEQLGENQDDVYDAILGNITAPYDFCSQVLSLAREYDAIYERGMKEGL